jgi:biotin carboxyl carrier protein
MKQEFTITLNDREYPVVAEDDAVTVNDRPFAVEITEEGQVLVDGIAYDVALEGESVRIGEGSSPLRVEGLRLGGPATAAAPAGARSTVEAGTGAVLAIMPGKIIRLLVEIGQAVEEGEPVCVLEAMKMENELNARQSGTVKAIHVSPGDDVEKDQALVEIE